MSQLSSFVSSINWSRLAHNITHALITVAGLAVSANSIPGVELPGSVRTGVALITAANSVLHFLPSNAPQP